MAAKLPRTSKKLVGFVDLIVLFEFDLRLLEMQPVQQRFGVKQVHLTGAAILHHQDDRLDLRREMWIARLQATCLLLAAGKFRLQQLCQSQAADPESRGL